MFGGFPADSRGNGGAEVRGYENTSSAETYLAPPASREADPRPPVLPKISNPKGASSINLNNHYHEKRFLENSSTDCRYSADRTGYRPDNNELHGSLKKGEAKRFPFFVLDSERFFS